MLEPRIRKFVIIQREGEPWGRRNGCLDVGRTAFKNQWQNGGGMLFPVPNTEWCSTNQVKSVIYKLVLVGGIAKDPCERAFHTPLAQAAT